MSEFDSIYESRQIKIAKNFVESGCIISSLKINPLLGALVKFQKICVIGLGYIGLPTASTFAAHGVNVLGVDINSHIIETLNRGEIHIHEPGLREDVTKAIRSGKFRVAIKPEEADAFIIAVPTPFQENKFGQYNDITYKLADMRAVISAAESILPFLRKGNLVVLESTSPPRTTVDLVTTILARSGLEAGRDFHLVYSPERVLPGQILRELIENARVIGGGTLLIATYFFAFQIYCDFSGYSDIARGLAKWMGYDFMVNFNHPYTSLSLREFWTRWHISLSSWFRDYVYIPLGGNKHGKLREAANLWATMLLSGLWHGASWNFVFWGALHAGFLSLEKLMGYPRYLAPYRAGRILLCCVVSIQVLVAWVFFRAPTLDQAVAIVGILFTFGTAPMPAPGFEALILCGGMCLRELYVYLCRTRSVARPEVPAKPLRSLQPTTEGVVVLPRWGRQALSTLTLALAIWAILFLRGRGHEFIYFQF